MLVSRSEERLRASEAEVKQAHPTVQTQIVQADFASDTSLGFYERIVEQTKGKDVSILVNNAGLTLVGNVEWTTCEEQKSLVDTNLTAVTMLT